MIQSGTQTGYRDDRLLRSDDIVPPTMHGAARSI